MPKRKNTAMSTETAMAEAERWLTAKAVDCQRLTAHHLKIDRVNFWPKTGTITVDADGAGGQCVERGLTGLEIVLMREGIL